MTCAELSAVQKFHFIRTVIAAVLPSFAGACVLTFALLYSGNARAEKAPTVISTAVSAPNPAPTFKTLFRDQNINVASLKLDAADALFTVDLLRSNKQISVIFQNGVTQDRLWKRLWFSKGDAKLTTADQGALRESFSTAFAEGSMSHPNSGTTLSSTMSTIEAEADFEKAKAVVDFLANFLPPEETLAPFDSHVNLPTGFLLKFRPYALESRYNMICDSIGKIKTASFTTCDGKSFSKDVVVGAIDSECRGRCGTSCEQAGQWRHNQYTEECLSHDLCHNTTNTQLGPCLDMFWKAAPGYLFAPDCTEKAIAVGPNIPVIIPTPPAGSTSTAEPIPDPNPNDGSITTPHSQAPPEAKPSPFFRD